MSALPSLRNLRTALLGAAALLLVTATTSLADTTVKPAQGAATDKAGGYFVREVKPGQTYTESVVIENTDTKPASLALAVVGSQTGEFGGVVYDLPEDAPTDAATWVALSTDTVTIPAKGKKTVDLTVQVPDTAAAGTHLAGLSISPAEDGKAITKLNDGPVSAGVQLKSRRVLAVQVDVAGPRQPALEGSDAEAAVKPQGVFARVTLHNPGTDLIRPTGTFTLADPSGNTVIEQPFELGTVVPGTDVAMAFAWSKETPAAGTYPVHVTATDASGATLDWNDTIVIDGGVAEQAADRIVPTIVPSSGPDMTLIAIVAGVMGALALAIVGLVILMMGRSRRREQDLRDELMRRNAFGPYGQPNPYNGPMVNGQPTVYGPPTAYVPPTQYGQYGPTNQPGQPGPWMPGPNDRPDGQR